MTVWMFVWALIATLAAIVGLVGYLRQRRAVRAVTQASQVITDDNQHLSAELQLTRDARDDYRARIEAIVKEATAARSRHAECGASHAGAQGMMLREIESLSKQYIWLATQFQKATGKQAPRPTPQLNAQIQTVADDFRDAHVDDALLRQILAGTAPSPDPAAQSQPPKSAP